MHVVHFDIAIIICYRTIILCPLLQLSESAELTVIDQMIAEMLFHVENIVDRDSPPFNN